MGNRVAEPAPPPPPLPCHVKFGRALSIFWRGIFSIVWPIIWLPVLIVNFHELKYRCLYLVIIMAGYWVTECIPLPITSTLPIVFFPLMSIMHTEETCMEYFKETNVMFIGGIMIALAIEHSKLHYRLALAAILLIGCSPRKLHFGMMMITMLISYWISNTAATAMMCPIIMAILEEMEKQGMGPVYEAGEDAIDESKRPSRMTIAYYLSATYASTIGGCATIVGTGTNLTYRGLFNSAFPDKDGINFARFMLFNAPTMLVINILAWLIVEVMYLGLFRPNSEDSQVVKKGNELKSVAEEVMREKLKDLGFMTWHEIWVLILFFLTILGWFFRSPGFMTGWPDVLVGKHMKIKDATVAYAIIAIMFLIPAKPLFHKAFYSDQEKRPTKASEGLITWKLLHQKVPWGLMFLLGGGFALAKGSAKSGMSKMVSEWLSELRVLPTWLITASLATLANFMTELSANVAIANIVIPITLQLALQLNTDPLYLSMPTAICCSFSFMLPVGTPGNAVAKGYVNLPTNEMAKAGFFVSIAAVVIYICAWESYGRVIYKFNV